jgi:hypothetical protein
MKTPDLAGKVFHRLRVLELAPAPLPPDAPVLGTRSGRTRPRWRCRCTCRDDVEIIVFVCTHDLRGGRVRSCGCLRAEGARAARWKVAHVILNLPHEQVAAWRAAAGGLEDVRAWLIAVADQAAAAAGFPVVLEPPPNDGNTITINGRTYVAPATALPAPSPPPPP